MLLLKIILKAKHYILIFILFITAQIKAQQPSHFVLGEEELAGIDIYDLFQDKSLNYWIASNNGIYKYDGYNINHLDCEGMLSNSVFNFTQNNKGIVYCHNLNGQIFQIINDTCSLYYTIPDSLMNHEINIRFDDSDRLIVFTNYIFEINEALQAKVLYPHELTQYNFVVQTEQNHLVLYNNITQDLITIKGGKLHNESVEIENPISFTTFIELDKKFIAIDRRAGTIIRELSDSVSFNLPQTEGNGDYNRYYVDNKSLWLANLTGGANYYKDASFFSENNNLVFKKQILSSFLVDNEKNTLFGTFGKGIIVVPNKNFIDVTPIVSESDVLLVTKTNNGNIIFGTQQGELIQVDENNKFELLSVKSHKRIEILEYIPELKKTLYNGFKNTLIDENTYVKSDFVGASIKDICHYEQQEFLVCTNAGLYRYSDSLKNFYKPQLYKGRTYSVNYDNINKTVYYGTASGLKIGKINDAETFKLNDNDLISTDIKFYNNQMYVSTKRNGVLIFKNDTLNSIWNVNSGLLSNNVKQIMLSNDKFFIATNKGINVLSKAGKSLSFINKTNGLNSTNIVDFEIQNEELWVVTNKGVQKIQLNEIYNEKFTPNIQINKVLVNNVVIDTNIHEFEHTADVFMFDISSKSLRYRNNIYYEYQLEGVDKNWIKSNFENHIFEYKSLVPNTYTFKVKAIYENNYSETINYKFRILKPFWLKSGFYSILIVLFLVSMFTLLNVQIRKQKNKITIENQLNKSQLTALKSQMNPHFIFNSLNSIQDLILKQDRENAYNYISKFALLVRKILNHSDKEFIDFEEEINILKIYLELEELRFKKDFKFTIRTNDISDIEIPPMLIQPFVENALKHGLLHKKGEKRLSINFYLKSDILFCEIIDNGIGRQKSNEIKQRQNKAHNSFSVKSIQTRFDILKELYGENIGVNIIDIIENNESVGTKVVLKIPFNKYF